MKGSFKKEERRGLPGGPNEMFTYTTGVFSTQGYKANSPDVDNPFNIIPSGDITMDGVEFPVHGVDNLGNSSIMLPGNDYKFPGDMVFEKPMQDLSLKSNPSRKEVLGYGFAFPEQRERNVIAGAGVNFLPIGTQFSAVGVLPMQSNPVFKGVGSLNASKQVGDFNIGIGANKDFINDYETGDRVKTPIKPSFNVKYTKRFHEGGEPGHEHPWEIQPNEYKSEKEYKAALAEYNAKQNAYNKRLEKYNAFQDLNLKYSNPSKWEQIHGGTGKFVNYYDDESYLNSGSDKMYDSLTDEIAMLNAKKTIAQLKDKFGDTKQLMNNLVSNGYLTEDQVKAMNAIDLNNFSENDLIKYFDKESGYINTSDFLRNSKLFKGTPFKNTEIREGFFNQIAKEAGLADKPRETWTEEESKKYSTLIDNAYGVNSNWETEFDTSPEHMNYIKSRDEGELKKIEERLRYLNDNYITDKYVKSGPSAGYFGNVQDQYENSTFPTEEEYLKAVEYTMSQLDENYKPTDWKKDNKYYKEKTQRGVKTRSERVIENSDIGSLSKDVKVKVKDKFGNPVYVETTDPAYYSGNITPQWSMDKPASLNLNKPILLNDEQIAAKDLAFDNEFVVPAEEAFARTNQLEQEIAQDQYMIQNPEMPKGYSLVKGYRDDLYGKTIGDRYVYTGAEDKSNYPDIPVGPTMKDYQTWQNTKPNNKGSRTISASFQEGGEETSKSNVLQNYITPSDNTRIETNIFEPLTGEAAIANKEYIEAKKKEQEEFEKRQWKKYDDASIFDAALDRAQAFAVDPIGMTARFIAGDQAYFPGMGRGLLNSDSPEYENYLKSVGYTPGEIETSDIQNMINPLYWGASIGNNLNKGNYGTAALEAGLTTLPLLPKGTGRALASNVTQGSKRLVKIPHRLKGYPEIKTPNTNISDDVARAGIDGNFITKPLTPFTRTDIPKDFTTWYRKIGGKKGLQDLLEKQGAQAPKPMKMKSGETVDNPFFGEGVRPSENYRGKYAVGVKSEALNNYAWTDWVGGTQNYGFVPVVDGKLIKKLPLEDLDVYKRKWFSNNYKKLDPKNLASEAERSAMQEYLETVWKWGSRATLVDEFLNDGDLRKEYIEKPIGDLLKKQSGGEELSFEEWYKTVPESKNDTVSYNLRRAYELAPQEELDAFVNTDAHLRSAYKQENGIYEFVKRKDHDTVQNEIDWYKSDDPNAVKFREEYDLDDSGEYYRYVPKYQTKGELSYEDKLKQAQYKIDDDGEGYYDLRYSLPEVDITVTPSFAKDLPYYNSLKPEEKEWLRKNKDSDDAITRGIRAQAQNPYGKDGNLTYGESVAKFATNPFLQMGEIAVEATGIPSAYRISQDPIGTAKGAANTYASLTTLPAGVAKGAYNYYNKGEFDMGNTIMNQPYFEGADKALDLLGVIPDIGIFAKGVKQGLKKGIPAVRRAYVNRFANPNDYKALVDNAAAQTDNMRTVAPSMERAALRYTNAWRQPQRSLHFDYKKDLDEVFNLRSEAQGNKNLLMKEHTAEIDDAARVLEENKNNIIRTASSFEDAGQKIKLLEDQYDEVVGGLKEQHKKAIREYDDYFKETDAYIRETEKSIRKTSADPDFRAKAERIVKEGEYNPKTEFGKYVDGDARYNPTFPNTEARTVRVTINKRKGPESLLKDPNFQKLSKYDQDYLLENYNDLGGLNTKNASITFLEDVEAPSLKTIQDNVYENTGNTWNPKKIREAYEKEFQIENDLVNKSYKNELNHFQETVVHESAHDSQKYMNWLKRLTKEDPEFVYDITKGDSDIAKQFKEVLKKPVKEIGADGKPVMSTETWEASAGELHPELDRVRFKLVKNWINKREVATIEEGVQLLKKMEREGSDKLYKFYDYHLKRHWDKSATYDKKKAVLQMLPALTGFGVGVDLVGESMSEESPLPQQQKGGEKVYTDRAEFEQAMQMYNDSLYTHNLTKEQFYSANDWMDKKWLDKDWETIQKGYGLKKEGRGEDGVYREYFDPTKERYYLTYEEQKKYQDLFDGKTKVTPSQETFFEGYSGLGAKKPTQKPVFDNSAELKAKQEKFSSIGGSVLPVVMAEDSTDLRGYKFRTKYGEKFVPIEDKDTLDKYFNLYGLELPIKQQGGEPALRDNTYVDIKAPQLYEAPIDNTRVEKDIVPEPTRLAKNIDFEGLRKGIAQAESLGGTLMINPESTATGLYGQRFSEIEDFYKGTREDFSKDTAYQNELFKKRFYEGLKDTKTTALQKDAMDLYDEYRMQIDEFPYSYEDIAALSNFLGRQGTREYFGYVVRDGKKLKDVFPTKYGAKAKQANKTPEEYLKITRPYYTKSGGGEILKVYADYINGVLDDTPMYKKGGRIYDKLNRIYYKDAKEAGMSSPNYIMSYLVN